MARAGKIHMLNNYFSSTTASNCINPRKNSEFLIEGNYFEKGVKKYYSQSGAIAVTWKSDNYIAESGTLPSSVGSTVSVPYQYTVAPYSDVPAIIKEKAGATLKFNGTSGIEKTRYGKDAKEITFYNINGCKMSTPQKGINIQVTTYNDYTKQTKKIIY